MSGDVSLSFNASDVADRTDRIIDAAAMLFIDAGLERVSMHAVAARAGVSRATLYRRFPSREQLVGAVVLDRARTFLEQIPALPRLISGLGSQLEAAFVIGVRDMSADPVLSRLFAMGGAGRSLLLHVVELREAIGEAIRPLLESARAAGELRPELDTDEVVAWLLRQQFALVDSGPWDNDSLVHQVRTFIVPALVSAQPALGIDERLARIEGLLDELRRAGRGSSR